MVPWLAAPDPRPHLPTSLVAMHARHARHQRQAASQRRGCGGGGGSHRLPRRTRAAAAACPSSLSLSPHQHQGCRSSSNSSSSSSQRPPRAAAAAYAADPAHAALEQLVAARGLDIDAGLVAQEAAATYDHLSRQQDGQLPPGLTAERLAERALVLTDLLATGSTFRTLQMLKRHPALLQMPPDEVANQVLQLKLLLPAANVAQLLFQKPSLLLIRDLPAVVGTALAKLHALMPGIPVEGKLHEGGTVFWSFASLLPQESSGFSAASRAPAADGDGGPS